MNKDNDNPEPPLTVPTAEEIEERRKKEDPDWENPYLRTAPDGKRYLGEAY